uniref:BHLH domain-containing protein n=1 Tax=Plectus sambesii TaxID=2011161 RepID=A0A914WUW9_9BILA
MSVDTCAVKIHRPTPKRPAQSVPVAAGCLLPLKKRLYALDDEDADDTPEPVDFTLPTRVRAAKVSLTLSSASSIASCSSSSSSKHSPGSTHTSHSDTDSERHCDDDSQLPSDAKVSPSRPFVFDATAGSSLKSSPQHGGALPPASLLTAATLPHLYSSPWAAALNPLLQQQLLQAATFGGLYPFGLLHTPIPPIGVGGLSPAALGSGAAFSSTPSSLSPSPTKQTRTTTIAATSSELVKVKTEPADEAKCSSSDNAADRFTSSASPPSTNYVINPATGNKVRRNYKNTTKERRSEANARERTRVHTIGASFDQLRHLMPSLAADQKLSKLSILRISCKYILLLGAMVGKDYSEEQRGYSVAECIDMLNDTILAESKTKRQQQLTER